MDNANQTTKYNLDPFINMNIQHFKSYHSSDSIGNCRYPTVHALFPAEHRNNLRVLTQSFASHYPVEDPSTVACTRQ
jgi:hypothetical protein